MAKSVSPGITVSKNQNAEEAEATHGGRKNQRDEEHYRKIADRSMNHAPEQEAYSRKRPSKK